MKTNKKGRASTVKAVTDDAAARIIAEQIRKVIRAEEVNTRREIEERLLANIEIVHEYDEYGKRAGFGFKSDGKLVEFNIQHGSDLSDAESKSWENEMSLVESLEWIVFMDKAAGRLCPRECLQTGDGWLRWISALHFALKQNA